MPVIDPTEFKVKVGRCLNKIYGGEHNWPAKVKWVLCPDFQMAEMLVSGQYMSTFDFPGLTCLVIWAHDECVRVEVTPCNMQYLRIRFHPRLREGRMCERHPTIEEAVAKYRR